MARIDSCHPCYPLAGSSAILKMRFEQFVALRYLKAKRKQAVISVISLISVTGVAAGVAALIVALSLNAGFQREFQSRIL
ncbi:MAG: hypothetical protein EHM23_32855, partial [Acidobacteria bacterium]